MNEKFKMKVKESGFSAYRLSKVSGVPYTNISELMTEKKDINQRPVEAVYKIAAALGCKPENIMNPISIMSGVSGIYRNIKYKWENEAGHMVLDIVYGGKKDQIQTPYTFCVPEKKQTYITITELYLDMYIQEMAVSTEVEKIYNE